MAASPSVLKASETLTRLVPSLVTLIAYTASFVFLALSLRTIPIGIAYAIWAGLGIVGRGSVRSLQTKLQTNHATQDGIGHYKPGSSEGKWQTRANG